MKTSSESFLLRGAVRAKDRAHRKKETKGVSPSLGGMIVREKEPLNLETPFAALNDFLTPLDRFFIRSHFAIPEIDRKTWRLRIEGEVDQPFELSFTELKKMAPVTVPVTLECAGNGRAFLAPQTKGAQWERGAVSNAKWTGIPLANVLRRAGVAKTALEAVLEGA